MSKLTYKRILLKVSGEVLMGPKPFGIDLDTVGRIADEVIGCVKAGAQLALVIGGGNIFRGLAGAAKGMDRVSADHMGIMATVMNALAMQGVLTVQRRRCPRPFGHRHADRLRDLFARQGASIIWKRAGW